MSPAEYQIAERIVRMGIRNAFIRGVLTGAAVVGAAWFFVGCF